ncbi:hypothetical protein KUCAC02_005827 [Chaenocephalus aceratus]|uniref:Uncharacterized protein n=1 Tax=Chaenocephalus aceratus TaxID=36190 RepID=A0ACB9WQ93_CHAAC|nr:hypothetical protein KUCAC02_005827 [Chaenocephalus aceratus]
MNMMEEAASQLERDPCCGNGKYLHINKEVFKMGCDVCPRPWWTLPGAKVTRSRCATGCICLTETAASTLCSLLQKRRIRAIKEMARTLRGGRTHHDLCVGHGAETSVNSRNKTSLFLGTQPAIAHGQGSPAKPRKRATAQSVSEAIANADKHRKVRSTSSSLDSVFDFWELIHLTVVLQRPEHFILAHRRTSLTRSTNLHKGQNAPGGNNNGPENQSVSVSLAQECGSLALPDLVPFQKEHLKQSSDESEGGLQGKEQHESTTSSQGSERQVEGSCLRYYHQKVQICKISF